MLQRACGTTRLRMSSGGGSEHAVALCLSRHWGILPSAASLFLQPFMQLYLIASAASSRLAPPSFSAFPWAVARDDGFECFPNGHDHNRNKILDQLHDPFRWTPEISILYVAGAAHEVRGPRGSLVVGHCRCMGCRVKSVVGGFRSKGLP